MYNFANPYFLLLLLLIPVIVWIDLFLFKKHFPRITFPQLEILRQIQKRNSLLTYLPLVLKSLIIASLIIALARPRHTLERKEYTTEGIDIVFVIDVSGSMKAVDFKPVNRMEAAKKVALDFIQKRENDRIGIVTFASYAYTLTPLTTDYNVLSTVVSNIQVDEEQGGTAIGNGIAIGVARLKDSPSKSKVMILLTDGDNNAGEIDPISAAEIAKLFDIKIYTIAVASLGPVDFPVKHPIYGTTYRKVTFDIDLDMLNAIAEMTGTGKGALAYNTDQLENILENINRLETTEIDANVYYEHKELFIYFVIFAMLLLFILILSKTIFKISLP